MYTCTFTVVTYFFFILYTCNLIKESDEEEEVKDEQDEDAEKDEDNKEEEEDNRQENEWEEVKNKVNTRERGDGQVRHFSTHT